MSKANGSALLGAALLAVPLAVSVQANGLDDRFFAADAPAPKLSAQERRALAIVQRWQAGTAANARPLAGRGGAVQFVFGVQEPRVVCAVLQVCDIALQPGEQVNSIQLGDTARWNAEAAVSGTGAAEVQHILLKPLDVDLQTSLVVTTGRRTYHIRLRSHRTKYMPQVSFVYPQDVQEKWDAIRARERRQRVQNTLPTGEYLGNLSFAYDISGSAPWKPVRVFNDGNKTIIQMPQVMQQTEAPVLLVVGQAAAEPALVNYRLQQDRYIVDQVFDRALLIAGVGRSQTKITITRSK